MAKSYSGGYSIKILEYVMGANPVLEKGHTTNISKELRRTPPSKFQTEPRGEKHILHIHVRSTAADPEGA